MTPPEITTVHLVACVGLKRAQPCVAKDLYVSPWFLKARAYVEREGGPWFILSAEHGLVSPDEVVAPYDTTLRGMKAADRWAWALKVRSQLGERHLGPWRDGLVFVFLAGQLYRADLAAWATCYGRAPEKISVPMRGLAIGQQLAWLDRQQARPAS